MIEHPAFTASQNAYAEQLETEARQRWAMGATESARARREQRDRELIAARISLWGEYRSEDNG